MQGGLHAANTVLRRLKGQPTKPFSYRDLGSVATIGRFRAVVSVKGIHLSGFPGWMVWMFVHLAFLTGFGNRLSTMMEWLRSMIGRGRAEREFSTAHTGGDLSLPDRVREEVEPTLVSGGGEGFPIRATGAARATGPGQGADRGIGSSPGAARAYVSDRTS